LPFAPSGPLTAPGTTLRLAFGDTCRREWWKHRKVDRKENERNEGKERQEGSGEVDGRAMGNVGLITATH